MRQQWTRTERKKRGARYILRTMWDIVDITIEKCDIVDTPIEICDIVDTLIKMWHCGHPDRDVIVDILIERCDIVHPD